MPTPTTAGVTRRPELASFEEFDLNASREGFITSQILPFLDVQRQSGSIGKMKVEELLKTENVERAPGAAFSRGNSRFETYSFECTEKGVEEPVDDIEAQVYRDYFEAETVATQRCIDRINRAREIRGATALQDTGTFTNTAVSVKWNSHASAKPIDDIHGRIKAIRLACGKRPNVVALDFETYLDAIECSQVIERAKYAGIDDPKNIDDKVLAKLFKVERLVIAGASTVKNTAKEGQTRSLSAIWDRTKVGIGIVAKTRDPREVCVGRSFHWNWGKSSEEGFVESYREEQTSSEVIRARHCVQEKIIYSTAWQILTGAYA